LCWIQKMVLQIFTLWFGGSSWLYQLQTYSDKLVNYSILLLTVEFAGRLFSRWFHLPLVSIILIPVKSRMRITDMEVHIPELFGNAIFWSFIWPIEILGSRIRIQLSAMFQKLPDR